MTLLRLLASVLLISALALAPRAATLTAAQAAAFAPGTSQAAMRPPEYGPPNGTLVIAGGSTEGLILPIYDKFIELGGGVDGRFVVVPTAMGNFDETGAVRVYLESQILGFWRSRGLKHVKMLHTHDPRVADTVEFANALSDATGVWFTGGRHHRIVDSYAGTLTYREFHRVLERGGVIGGNSAGATIQGEYLVRGDSRGNHIVMTDEPNHQRAFEFLRKSAIDQHIDARNRWDDLIPVIKRFPNLLGIGIAEDTAIVVKGDRFEVMGKSQVAIHDNTRKYPPRAKPYYLLGAGDTYDMRTREIVTYGDVRRRLSTAEPTGTARPNRPSPDVVQESRSAATPPAARSARPAAPSRPTLPSGATMDSVNGRGAVPVPLSITLQWRFEHLLMVAGEDETWRQIELIDVDADGEVDLLRIHLVHLINGGTRVWEIER